MIFLQTVYKFKNYFWPDCFIKLTDSLDSDLRSESGWDNNYCCVTFLQNSTPWDLGLTLVWLIWGSGTLAILHTHIGTCAMPSFLQISHLLLRVKVQAFRLLTTQGTDVEYLEAQLGLLMKLRSRNCERLRDLMVLEKINWKLNYNQLIEAINVSLSYVCFIANLSAFS